MATSTISFIDLIVCPVLLIFFYFIANSIRARHLEQNSSYQYYVSGLMAKMLGAVGVCLIYIFYYRGGDTVIYFNDSIAINKLFFKDPWQAIRLTFLSIDAESLSAFDAETGWPYYYYDFNTFAVDRLIWVLNVLSFRSFIGQTMLLSFVCYPAIWRLYQTIIYEFPDLKKQMAFAILFIPSVVFWGSGLLKDTITFASVCLVTSSLHQMIKLRKNIFKNFIYFLFAAYLLIIIKPYILFALLPGSVLWFGGMVVGGVKNKLLKRSLTPFFLIASTGGAFLMLQGMGDSLGEYRLENVLNKAVKTQQDLKQDYYGGSTFDIGDFDPTIGGVLSKAPVAINAALFRPYLWEARNPAMIVSGIENAILLAMTIYFLWKLRFFNLFRLMFRHHFLFFSLSFSIFFAFSVGLSTSNFGSMVRYKIPAIPFYVASLFIIAHTYSELKRKEFEPDDLLKKEEDLVLAKGQLSPQT
jgi:hypothetical protein